jgi:predicted phage baseplate assembly protein
VALIGPILDDRTYAQLKSDLVKRIPVYAPEWTDHNESDPGIALLELFAHLGESLLFRFNQIPDATKVAFLRLLGVEARPAVSARALLALTTERPEGAQVLRGAAALAGAVPFETDDEVYTWPLSASAAGKVAAPRVDDDDPGATAERHRRADARAAQEVDEDEPHAFYVVRTLGEDPNAADAATLDVSETLDRSLWVALVAEPTADPSLLRGRTIFVGVAFDESVDRPFDLVSIDDAAVDRLRADGLGGDPPAMLWELWQGPDSSRHLLPLDVVGDSTRGMTTTGVVKLVLPERFPTHPAGAQPLGDRTSPPPLDDEKLAAKVVAWLRVRRPDDENDAIHRVRWVGLNAVSVTQASTAAPELLSSGTAEPGQTYRLTQRGILAGSVHLEVEEPDGWVEWTEVDTLVASGSADRHFTVDLVEGTVTFGRRSLVPQLGERIRVTSYRYGGGSAGNVSAGAITGIAGTASVKATNVLAAAGGSDAATLAEALDAVPGEVHRRDRAVVADDFAALAEQVRGVQRAEALPLLHPDTPAQEAAGVVSVVVFPTEDLAHPEAPLPDLALLRRVARYLDPRRLATCELYVIPPTYQQVAISVGVRVRDGYQVDAVRRWVELILRQYLAPVPPYGPDGSGWPLGRAVRRAELEAVCAQVDGVEFIEEELLLARAVRHGGTTSWTSAALVELERWEVPEVTRVTVVSGRPLPIDGTYGAENPGLPELVPLPPDVC